MIYPNFLARKKNKKKSYFIFVNSKIISIFVVSNLKQHIMRTTNVESLKNELNYHQSLLSIKEYPYLKIIN